MHVMRPLLFLLLAGCTNVGTLHAVDAGLGDPQTPPTGKSALEAWIAQGSYVAWHCETAPHPARDPSPHGMDRICSNDLLSAHAEGPYPVGAANVKELFDDDGNRRGHAVYRHILPGDDPGAWYWYEIVDGEVLADGLGDSGKPQTSCVACHSSAGPDVFGHDLVFTQVH
jgi:hypothetical protein